MFILWLKDSMSAITQPGQTERRCHFLSAVIIYPDVSRDGWQCHPQAALVNLSCCGSKKGSEKRRGRRKKYLRKAFYEWARRQCLDPWDAARELRWKEGPRCFSGVSTDESNTPGSGGQPGVSITDTHAGHTRRDRRSLGSQKVVASCSYNEVLWKCTALPSSCLTGKSKGQRLNVLKFVDFEEQNATSRAFILNHFVFLLTYRVYVHISILHNSCSKSNPQ